MTGVQTKPRLLQVLEALKTGHRDDAQQLLAAELRYGPPTGDRWRSVSALAARIGEIELALEAAGRFARTEPVALERLLFWWSELASHGRTAVALAEVDRLAATTREHPAVLHFLGTIAGQTGDFVAAEDCFRRALAITPMLPQTWFALAMIKRFRSVDPDLIAMEELRPRFSQAAPELAARFIYGLAKAHYDLGDLDRAFALYAQGAELRRSQGKFDSVALARQVDGIMATFTPAAMQALRPSGEHTSRPIFVNGLPRSGTTLVEQMLVSHSNVVEGGEINALRQALIPTVDYGMSGAFAFEHRMQPTEDPWGTIAGDYLRIATMWFGASGRFVDKTLSQSRLMGLLLHILPEAPVLWIRRSPEDAALSCYRSFFSSDVSWSWSLADIGHFFREEDRLFKHWTANFGSRILVVSYEDLVRDPTTWVQHMLDHCSLTVEPQVFQSHLTQRDVRTASVQQVRAPISSDRIGSAAQAGEHMRAFSQAYHA